MKTKRIIPCIDTKDGKAVKGVQFKEVKEINTPQVLAEYYNQSGADELVLYDITASSQGRLVFEDMVKDLIQTVDIPLTVGGGIATLEDADKIFQLGADKVSINSGAIKNPELLKELAKKYGSDRLVLGVDAAKVGEDYHVFTKGGREDTGLELMAWLRKCVDLGVGEIVANSIDADGTKQGFDLPMLKEICQVVDIPVIASGGAGSIQDFIDLFTQVPAVDGGLAASIFHFKELEISDLKEALDREGIPVKKG